MPTKRKSTKDRAQLVEIGERLKRLRAVFHLRQIQMAEQTHISPSSWNSYEKGKKKISVDHALQVAEKTGVTLDWIYRGHQAALPDALNIKLAARKPINGQPHNGKPHNGNADQD